MSQQCHEVLQWVEEEVVSQVEDWVERREEKCARRKCKKLCLCCNKWFCWIEVILEKVVTTVVTTVVKLVTVVVCEVIVLVLELVNLIFSVLVGWVGWFLHLLCKIPILGGILRWLYEGLTSLVWFLASIPDMVLGVVGVLPPKMLRVRVLVVAPEGTDVTARLALAERWITDVKDIFKRRANVRVVPPGQPFSLKIGSPAGFVAEVPKPKGIVQECGAGMLWDDLGFNPGPWYQETIAIQNLNDYLDGARRLVKYGAPIYVFMIDDVKGTGGCSLGPIADYVVVGIDSQGLTVAHELGHACLLAHVGAADNLMKSIHTDNHLKKWQKIMFRSSEHVTYY